MTYLNFIVVRTSSFEQEVSVIESSPLERPAADSSGWKRLFDSSWGRFDIRFKGVISDLKYHADLIDKDANAASIAAAEEWRRTHLEEVKKNERDRSERQLQAVLSWLDTRDYVQEDYLNELVDRCCTGTSTWFLDHAKVKLWINAGDQHSGLWVNGIPGSGKYNIVVI